eukprot:CAMPEP_0115086392 /NCGR_PEP_ID=MMETSP0227-20121206/22558_1 /TAXON_ID=89957 /ORGANISM="Polarella glacialis, Strain CCMP 1383" /LENGTH=96 /DNA_ID=CAMNT_0002475841 /DNA_START=31 /DNA_END=317 /DNA_ORIENTATION=+
MKLLLTIVTPLAGNDAAVIACRLFGYSAAKRVAAMPRAASEEEADDLATSVLALRLMVIHDAVRCREHKVPELTRGQDVTCKLHDAVQGHVEARRD